MGGAGHPELPLLGREPIGWTPDWVHASRGSARVSPAARRRPIAPPSDWLSELSACLALFGGANGDTRSREAGIAGVVAQLFPLVGVPLPSCVWLGLGFSAVESVLSGSKCGGVLREHGGEGGSEGRHLVPSHLPERKRSSWRESALSRESDDEWWWWGSQALVSWSLRRACWGL